MRLTRLIGGAAWMLAVSLTAQAGPVPYQATVVVPEVEVRCLPSASANSYATSKLPQGAVVEVLDEKEAGWLAIKPPPGSFSWVQTRFLDRPDPQKPYYGVILGEGVEVRLGCSAKDRKPDVFQVRLPRGTDVVILDTRKVYDEETGGWVRIQPPPQEVRYIPADAVKVTGPVQTVSSASSPAGLPASPVAGVQTVETHASAAVPAATHPMAHQPIEDPLWLQAKQAEKEGKIAEAESLYLQLAKQTTDHDLCIRCYNHIHYMKSQLQGATGPAPPTQPVAAGENRLVPTAAIPYPQVVGPAPATTARATSQYTYIRATVPPAGAPAPATAPPQAAVPQPPPAPASQLVGPGLLVRAISPVAGQPAYMLDRGQGQPILYILPSPGVNLDPYVNTTVSVSGPIAYHQGYRREVLTAVQVTPRQ
jgi:hypothetical protein